jgi:hypothetical protein
MLASNSPKTKAALRISTGLTPDEPRTVKDQPQADNPRPFGLEQDATNQKQELTELFM